MNKETLIKICKAWIEQGYSTKEDKFVENFKSMPKLNNGENANFSPLELLSVLEDFPLNDWLPSPDYGDYKQYGPWIKHTDNKKPFFVRASIGLGPSDGVIYLTKNSHGVGRNFHPPWDEITFFRLLASHPYYRGLFNKRTPLPAQ